MEESYFPSEEVDEEAFRECFFRFKNLIHTVDSDPMRKNELALKIASEYYKEGYTKRVIELAEYMYFRTSENFHSATISEKKVETPKPKENRPSNPYSRYRI
ncbi:MAG: hypothetical protein WC358_01975 [Ignavibacteria bacterium]|jgi:hypothetical protein